MTPGQLHSDLKWIKYCLNHTLELELIHVWSHPHYSLFFFFIWSYQLQSDIVHSTRYFNSYSASHGNWCIATLWNRIMTVQCEGIGEVGSARYEPALLPPCPSIRVLSYSNCQEIHSRQQTGLAVYVLINYVPLDSERHHQMISISLPHAFWNEKTEPHTLVSEVCMYFPIHFSMWPHKVTFKIKCNK